MLKLSGRAGIVLAALSVLLAGKPCRADDADPTVTAPEAWSVHSQATLVWQGYPSFHAEFSGANSLAERSQAKETADATLYLGAHLLKGLSFYADPEADQGFGLSDTLGVAGFPSGEAYKVGEYHPYFRLPRAYFHYVYDLGGETVTDGAAANQLAGSHQADNLTVSLGKFGVPDVFDTNKFAHDPRADFFNWAVIESGAFDYAADAWGFSYGAAAEWSQSWWTLRAGVFDLSRKPNSTQLERGFGQFEMLAETEARHTLGTQPGSFKLLLFANRGRMGSYDDAVALARQTGMPADTALVRRYASRPGGAFTVQQQVVPDLGVFLRASLNDGAEETFEFTDVNQSLTAGLSLQGSRWNRPSDTVGVAGLIEGISSAAQRYFAAGGLGLLIGDGSLPTYGREKILETYYSYAVAQWATVSVDYQFIDNPAYDPLRGPVSVFAVRVHAQF